MATPSTSRSERLRRPLDSPFPPSSPPAAATDANASSALAHGLSERHVNEIETAFRIFDPSLSGFVDLPTFEVMVRSLGFRMTKVEIAGMVESLWEERREREGGDDADAEERRRVDLPTAARILAVKGYTNRDEEDEMRMYFRIFDGGNKGYVSLDDLRRVQEEVKRAESELNIGRAAGAGGNVVGEATLRAMIEQFDENGDGVLDYDEFRSILEPVLSTSASS